MQSNLFLSTNKLCNDVPSQVQALSSNSFTNYEVTDGNSIGTVCGWIEDSRFPTAGRTSTTNISYIQQGLTGTVPSEFGALTDVTQFDIGYNEFTGALPTQLGRLTKLVTAAAQHGFLSGNDPDGATIPTELGKITSMTNGGYFLTSSKLEGSLPTEIGSMVDMGMWFNVQANSLSSTIPTELGNLVKMSSRIQLGSNSFTMSIPTQLGRISKMTHNFLLYSNKLCADTPTQVQALSSSVASGWSVTTGNELLGSPCTWPELPTMLPSDTSAIDYSGLSLTGTIPTQLGLYTLATTMDLGENTLTGTIPSELGNLVKMESGFVCYSNQLSGAVPTELGQLRTISKLFKLHTNQLTSSIPTQLGQVTPETHAFPSPHTIETPSTKSKAADFHGMEISKKIRKFLFPVSTLSYAHSDQTQVETRYFWAIQKPNFQLWAFLEISGNSHSRKFSFQFPLIP